MLYDAALLEFNKQKALYRLAETLHNEDLSYFNFLKALKEKAFKKSRKVYEEEKKDKESDLKKRLEDVKSAYKDFDKAASKQFTKLPPAQKANADAWLANLQVQREFRMNNV